LIFELCTIFLIFNIVLILYVNQFFQKGCGSKISMAEYKLKTKRERFTFPPNLKKAFACLVLRNLKFYILDWFHDKLDFTFSTAEGRLLMQKQKPILSLKVGIAMKWRILYDPEAAITPRPTLRRRPLWRYISFISCPDRFLFDFQKRILSADCRKLFDAKLAGAHHLRCTFTLRCKLNWTKITLRLSTNLTF